MSNNVKTIISMLVADKGLSLFTVEGSIMEIKNDDVYDTPAIIEFLTGELNGTNAIEIDLTQYLQDVFNAEGLIDNDDFEKEGQISIQMIDGKEVEGIFFAKKPQIAVRVGEEQVVIPDVENLSSHMERALEDDSPGVKAFLKRLAPVMKDRAHSAKDLMGFIKGSELPLTNDGRVIVYKKVKSTKTKGVYVDCHSGNIKQRVGSRVIMPVEKVDPSRSNDCSNGLHVANIGYLKSFSGDTVLMCLVKPENFIAVPRYDKSKARVCEYDIIGIFTPYAFKMVSNSISMKNDRTMEALIQEAILGNIPDPIEEVHVGVKKIEKVVALKPKKKARKSKAGKRPSGKPLKPRKETEKTGTTKNRIVKTAKRAKAKVTGTIKPLTLKEQFMKLYGEFDAGDLQSFDEMIALKKAKKKSWKSLGFSNARIKRIEKQISNPPLFQPPAKEKTVKKQTIKAQAKALYAKYKMGDLAAFDVLVDLKTKKKKSWTALGFTPKEIVKITDQLSR